MKKIISVIAVVAILFTFSVAVSAATCTMTMDSGELFVQDGTQTIVLNVKFTLDEAVDSPGYSLGFDLPEGVALTAVDNSEYLALLTAAGLQGEDMTDLAVGNAQYYEKTYENTVSVSSLTIPCTFTVDTSEATTYTIKFKTDGTESGLCDADYAMINTSNPTATITVKAAGPSFEDNDYSNAKIVPNTNDIEVGGKKYTNVAVFDGSFSLASVELDEGESIKEAGVMFNGAKKATISVAGDGSVTYKVLFVGITPTEAAALNINTYYTLHEIAD